jgi:hypothetical protein
MIERSLWTMLALMLVPSGAPCQTVTAPAVVFSDLEGLEITANITHNQKIRREAREFPVIVERNVKLAIEGNETINFTVIQRGQSPRGTRETPPMSGRFNLNEERENPHAGGGRAVWSFQGGALTYTRAFEGGAVRLVITFTRGSAGVACTANEVFARETGKAFTLKSPVDGVPLTILSTKQASSSCKVEKKV